MILKRSATQRKLAGDASLVHYGHREAVSIAWLMGTGWEPFVGSEKADDACETYRIMCVQNKIDPDKKWRDS